jgi:hypothetical protein
MNTNEIKINPTSPYEIYSQADKSTLIPLTEKQIGKVNRSILETEALLEKYNKSLNGYLGSSMEPKIRKDIEFCENHIKKLQFIIEFGMIDPFIK